MAGYKQVDYENTYTTPDYANVRYASTAKKSINGWAYIYTKDSGYVEDLAYNRPVEVKVDNEWMPFSGEFIEPEGFPGDEYSASSQWEMGDDEQ